MAAAARNAGVSIATGDTKVVERGKADGLYITTTGVGVADPELNLSSASVRPGDKILCSGTLGDHGAAILIARGDLELEAEVFSDTRSLTPLVRLSRIRRIRLALHARPHARWRRNGPERAGPRFGYGVAMWEENIPIRDVVNGACEILGIDPLYVANEGKLLAVVAPELPTAPWRRCAGSKVAKKPGSSARSGRSPRGWSSCTPTSAAPA